MRFSPVVSLRYMANSHGTDSTIAQTSACGLESTSLVKNWQHLALTRQAVAVRSPTKIRSDQEGD
ncbi:hypothetical protein OH492_01910 [Vibrio chagasii]|nr:hypothetical protein [Vibrio chagasii]